jgi:hypothetical protein
MGEDVELIVIASSAIYKEGSPTDKLHNEFVNFLSKMNQTKGSDNFQSSFVSGGDVDGSSDDYGIGDANYDDNDE